MGILPSRKSNSWGNEENSSQGSSEALLQNNGEPDERISSKLMPRLVWVFTLLNTTILVFWVTTAILIFGREGRVNESFKGTSLYSPVFDKLNLYLDPSTINDTLWATDEATSIYTGDPSPEVDAAWNRVSAEGFDLLMISRTEAEKLHRDPKVIVKAPESWGVGSDSYLAQIDVFHQIHCLDELRKQIYSDYYYRPLYGDNLPPFHMAHKKHCLHKLLHSLMCQSNVDIITHNWREGTRWPLADFNPPSQCRNFEALLEWKQKTAMKDFVKKWTEIIRPDDAVVLPSPTPQIY